MTRDQVLGAVLMLASAVLVVAGLWAFMVLCIAVLGEPQP